MEKRKVVKRQDPQEPMPKEREGREKTHMPFRSWCRHCVRGNGNEEACNKTDRRHDLADVHMDFMFMGG